jgi:hypothetical protein
VHASRDRSPLLAPLSLGCFQFITSRPCLVYHRSVPRSTLRLDMHLRGNDQRTGFPQQRPCTGVPFHHRSLLVRLAVARSRIYIYIQRHGLVLTDPKAKWGHLQDHICITHSRHPLTPPASAKLHGGEVLGHLMPRVFSMSSSAEWVSRVDIHASVWVWRRHR